jgi:hypothetical protein
MVQPADSLLSKDPTRSYRTNPAVRCPLLKSKMRAVPVMVSNILRELSHQRADDSQYEEKQRWFTHALHTEGRTVGRQKVELAARTRWSDLHGDAPVLA